MTTIKFRHILKNYNLNTIDDIMKRSNKFGADLYNTYLQKLFSKGCFCTKPQAIKNIKNSGFNQKQIELLTEFIEHASILRSTDDAYNELINKSEANKILYWLELINTNSVVITGKIAKAFECKEIPELLDLVSEYMN